MVRGGKKIVTASLAAPIVKDPQRYKTELCATYSRTGACPYGHKCQFAHGVEELRMRQDQPLSYKTKACRSFARTGRCPYGPRCRFMHGDAREAQQLAALRLASDERPGVPPYSLDGAAGSAGAIFGLPQPQPGLATPMSASATASGLQPGGMGVVPGINDEHILAQLLARRTSGSSSECASEATSETPSRPGVLPLPHPTTSSHAVLLPYAQLPHGDLSKQPGAAMLAWGAYLDPAQLSPPSAPAPTHMPPPMASHLAQPGGGGASSRTSPSGASLLLPTSSPSGASTSLLPSPSSSLLSSNLPSAHPSLLPSPSVLPVALGSVTSPPPQQLSMLPPALLPATAVQLQHSAPQQHISVQLAQQPHGASAPTAAYGASLQASVSGLQLSDLRGGACGACGCGACGAPCGGGACGGGGACVGACGGGACGGGPCGGGACGGGACGGRGAFGTDASHTTTSSCGSRFGDALQYEAVTDTVASTNFTRSSIAKQLSVLFDDGGSSAENLSLLGQADAVEDAPQPAPGDETPDSLDDASSCVRPGASFSPKQAGTMIGAAVESSALRGNGPLDSLRNIKINVDAADSLFDQLAAVCCSPPRYATGGPWRGSSPQQQRRSAWH